MESVKAIVVSESGETRQQLKRLLERLEPPVESRLCSSLSEADEALNVSFHYSFVFASNGLPHVELAAFIETVRSSRSAGKSSHILLLKAHESDRKTISSAMVLGFHGLLREPFSLSALEETTKLLPGVRRTETRLRLRAATGLMISSFVRESAPNVEHASVADLLAEAEDSCRMYKEATGESVTTAVVKDMQEKPISKRIHSYNGASARVRDMVAKHLLGSSELLSHFKKLLVKR